MRWEISSEPGVVIRLTLPTAWLGSSGQLLALLGAMLIWLFSLRGLDVRQMNDLGLVSILPVSTYLALLILTVSFCWTVAQRAMSAPLLLLHVVILIFMLFGVTALIEEEPRFPVTWQHFGFIEYIVRTGTLAKGIDARFSWPGFFVLNAFLTQIAGPQSVLLWATWAAVCFNLLYLKPLMMIMSAATNDQRLVWLGVWFFYLTNWIGQDYFAPQAFNYFLYLVIIAILLQWFKEEKPALRWLEKVSLSPTWFGRQVRRLYLWSIEPALPISLPSGSQSGLIAVMILLFAVIVSSHQLTPFVLLVDVGLLVLLGRCRLRNVPLLIAIMILAWIAYMTADFFSGHMRVLLTEIGNLGRILNKNVTNRVQGSPQHTLIVYLRLVMTLLVWGLALLGGLRRLRQGYSDLSFVLLTVAPFALLGFQSYGGEALLRVYFFNLPFAAFFAAAFIYPTLTGHSSGRLFLVTAALSLLLLAGFQFTRYGNERMDFITHKDVAGFEYLYKVAPPKALFVTPSYYIPWAFRDVEKFTYATKIQEFLDSNLDAIAGFMADKRYPTAYLVFNHNQTAYAELFYGEPAGWGERLKHDLLASGKFSQLFDNGDVTIFTLKGAAEKGAAEKGATKGANP